MPPQPKAKGKNHAIGGLDFLLATSCLESSTNLDWRVLELEPSTTSKMSVFEESYKE
jgi:hypothetical protein